MKTSSGLALAGIVLDTGGLLAGCPDASIGDMSLIRRHPRSLSSDASTKHHWQDVMFAQMTIVHHQGAIAMAQEPISKRNDEAAKKLAESIVTAQNTEIPHTRAMLGSLN